MRSSAALSPIGRLFAVAALIEGVTWAGLLIGMWLKYGLQTTETVVWLFAACTAVPSCSMWW